ncbi:divergent polysaccharide deacetylase family protein [Aestuariispira insulae]|uniref:Polysaccharide deacetylase 2 family uncharacterized protein YibQ n=1 Tax=Aestuariispira insulae TaxID=1461337 RepID=A0A3D9HP77_9PROT|nr:divergent polysaccharide deacetylase family protein [Aestuariispira insulae]RED51269.1 polysaccharide deacetylase 2 family uncharacterized protein YibQ [Aestuariispira insulae]
MSDGERFALDLKAKIPKVNLSFLKGKDGADAADEDDLDYLEKTRFQKIFPWMSVGIAYLILVGGVAGTAIYLTSHEDEIAAEMRAKRPMIALEPITIRETRRVEASDGDDQSAPAEAENPLLALMPGRNEADGEETDPQMAEDTAGSGEQLSDADKPAEETDNRAGTETGDGTNTAAVEQPQEVPPGTGSGEDPYGGALIPHPDPNLVEESDVGPLPMIAVDGRLPWRVYSRPFNPLETRPRIAIVVTNLGLSDQVTDKAIELPGAMTLAFAPYSRKISEWIDKARGAGHEVLLTLPMEPHDFPMSDPGPYALMTSLDGEENVEKLHWIMSRATGYIGMVNFLGSKFNSSKDILRPVFAELQRRGLMYLETSEAVVSIVPELSGEMEVPSLSVDIVLDGPSGTGQLLTNLARLESRAKTQGYAIGLAYNHPNGIDRLESWSRDLAEKGIALIPLSAVLASGLEKTAGGS